MPKRIYSTKHHHAKAIKKPGPGKRSEAVWRKISWDQWVSFLKRTFSKRLTRSKFKSTASLKHCKNSKVSRNSKNGSNTPENNLDSIILNLFKFIFTIIFIPLKFVWDFGVKVLKIDLLFNRFGQISRFTIINSIFICLFAVVALKLAYLQTPFFQQVSLNREVLSASDLGSDDIRVIPATRGKIFIRDLNKGSNFLVAANKPLYKLALYPQELDKSIKNNKITINEFASKISSATNIDYFTIENKVKDALNKYQNGTRYYILLKEINTSQYQSLQNLIDPPKDRLSKNSLFSSYRTYISTEPIDSRIYPEQKMLASTLGFTQNNVPQSEATKIDSCQTMVTENQNRNTENKNGYTTGQYGVERAFCSELSGLNGKLSFSKDSLSQYDEIKVQDGQDIVLTMDKNIQSKAEEVLNKAIVENSNNNGKPISGVIIVSEVKTGRILAQASYPSFDPNEVKNIDYESSAVKNQASVAYEPGSVIKPLTIAAARDVYEKQKYKYNGQRLGVPVDFKSEDVPNGEEGLVITGADGRPNHIRNADNHSFKGVQSTLSDILRNSINTLIARIQIDFLNTETTKYYFLEKFRLGTYLKSFLYTSEPPNTRNFDKDINSPYSYANMAFGQGFTTTPLNLIQAYSALANNGCIVEPRIVETINDKPYRTNPTECENIIEPGVAKEVSQMLLNTIDVGFGNGASTRPSKARMENYSAAAKTGTAQISRPIIQKGQKPIPCSYDCNSNLGLYDHTFIGYAPALNPEIIVLVKLSQPKPGDRSINYAEFSSATFWKEITEYSLNYLGVKPDRVK